MINALKVAPFFVFSAALLSWNPPPAAAQGRSLAVDTVFRVDGHESVLEPIRFLVAGPTEEVAIVGTLSEKVRVFSASGEELPPFGRSGQGPGEFVGMGQGGWKADSLWIFDSRNLRFTLFCPGKEGFHTYPAQMGVQPSEGKDLPSFGLMLPIALRTDGSMLGSLGLSSSPDWEGKTIGLMGPEGTLQKIFARYQTPEGFFRVGDRGQSAGSSYPFEHRPKFDVSSDGSAAALALVEMGDDSDGVVVVTRFDEQKGPIIRAYIEVWVIHGGVKNRRNGARGKSRIGFNLDAFHHFALIEKNY